MENKIYFAKVDKTKETKIPTKREEDGCYDVYPNFEDDNFVIQPRQVRLVPTNIASAFSTKYRISVRERGSNTKSTLIVMGGQIDSGYRGEYFIALYNGKDIPVSISKEVLDVITTEDYVLVPYSKAIGQLAVEEVPQIKTEEISYEELLKFESERGTGKLGSSQK